MERIFDESFAVYLQEEEKSEHTREKYLRDVQDYLRWSGNAAPDKAALLRYKAELQSRYAPSSVNSKLSALNVYLDYLGCPECKVKMLKQQTQTYCTEKKELTRAEYERLVQAAQKKPRLQLLLQSICATGIRISEHPFLTVEAARQGFAEVNLKGKYRRVLLPEELCRQLLRYADGCGITAGSIFVTASGQPLNRSNIWREMKNLCASAGVAPEKVFPHNLRHLFARVYYSSQKDIVRLADILGHTSVNTTRIYTRESGQIHRKQIEELGLIITT